MKMLWVLSWRNLWRNKRRTLITAATVSLAVFISLLMRSMQEGSYSNMIDNTARFYSGYLQVQQVDFWKNKSIDALIPFKPDFVQALAQLPQVRAVLPRLETFMLAAKQKKTKGVAVLGIDMQREQSYAGLDKRLQAGRLPQAGEQAVLVGSRLAQYFGLQPGDELVLYGQGHHGNTAAGLPKISGIIEHPNPLLDTRLIYMPLLAAQNLLSAEGLLTAYVVNVDSGAKLDAISAQTGKLAAAHFSVETVVKPWYTLSPELQQQITLDRVSGQLLIAILYGIVGFGMFATVAVMALERKREFAVLIANGMNRRRLQALLLLESLQIGLLGSALGLLPALPLLWYLHYHPIPLHGEIKTAMESMGIEAVLPFAFSADIILMQPLVIFFLLALCVQYPLSLARRLNLPAALQA